MYECYITSEIKFETGDVHKHLNKYIPINACLYIYIYMCVCVCVCECVCVYISVCVYVCLSDHNYKSPICKYMFLSMKL